MPTDLNAFLKPIRDAAEERYPINGSHDCATSLVIKDYQRAFLAGARHALTEPIILRTAEELYALPVGSIVGHISIGRLYVQTAGKGWHSLTHDYALTPASLVATAPVELIRLPREEA
ncbi:hypothetical protein [Nesterenkonia suensis]